MILVIGEALIDLIENRYQPGSFNAIVGGANANVALALARRGTPHQFLGRISGDRFGKIIRDRLETNQVQLDYSIAADELTTLAVVSIDSHGVPSYSFYVNGTADWGWTNEDPTAAAPGTIRGDFGRDWGLKVQQNLVHGSDAPESAARELALWFS